MFCLFTQMLSAATSHFSATSMVVWSNKGKINMTQPKTFELNTKFQMNSMEHLHASWILLKKDHFVKIFLKKVWSLDLNSEKVF